MSKKTCLFCQNPANSLEHLWPDWIIKSVGKYGPIRQNLKGKPKKTFTGALKVRCVCVECNGGWMSNLETTVRPCLEPMIHDKATSLSLNQQEGISRWSVKMAIVSEATKPKSIPHFYRKEDCENFKLKGEIPEHTRVWLGRSSQSGFAATGTEVWFDESEVSKAGHGCVTTVVVGYLIIQVITVRLSAETIAENLRLVCKSGAWNELLLSIRPPSNPAKWPPALTLTNDAGPNSLLRLIERWKFGTEIQHV